VGEKGKAAIQEHDLNSGSPLDSIVGKRETAGEILIPTLLIRPKFFHLADFTPPKLPEHVKEAIW
jgi:hypothetical protein